VYDDEKYIYEYPVLHEWMWSRPDCQAVITSAGLPLPPKSSCFFCPSTRKEEILELRRNSRCVSVAYREAWRGHRRRANPLCVAVSVTGAFCPLESLVLWFVSLHIVAQDHELARAHRQHA